MLRMLLVIKSRLLLKRRPLPCQVQNISIFSSKLISFEHGCGKSPFVVTAITRTAGPCLEVHKTTVATATVDTVATVATASARAPRCSTFSGSAGRGRYAQGCARSDWNRGHSFGLSPQVRIPIGILNSKDF